MVTGNRPSAATRLAPFVREQCRGLRKPVVTEIAWREPFSFFRSLHRGKEGGLFLDGAADHADTGRYSYVPLPPLFTLTSANGVATLRTGEDVKTFDAEVLNLLAALEEATQKMSAAHIPGAAGRMPWDGGLAALLPYELNRLLEPRPGLTREPDNTPDIWAALYPDVVVFDNRDEKAWHISRTGRPLPDGTATESGYTLTPFTCPEGEREYQKKIQKIRQYIHEGDVYQVNLSRRLEAGFSGDPLALYGRMREVNPAAYGAYLNGGGFHLLSMSPEMFLRGDGNGMETRPIKGTAPRGADADEDRRLMSALRLSEKNRAENVMIVDLMRNDLSRFCRTGSVTVPDLCRVESLPTVHHLVSTVTGHPNGDAGLADIVAAAFPGGSITGAPKVRAMEIIREMEDDPRGFYCGSLMTAGANGSLNASILIRTLTVAEGRAVYRTGGGITADSDPQDEYRETLHKSAMLEGLVR